MEGLSEKKIFRFIIGMAFISSAIFLILSILFHNDNDPSFSVVSTNQIIENKMGIVGAYISDFSIKFFGIVSFFIALLLIKIAFNIIKNKQNTYNPCLKIINFLIFY